MSNRASSPIAMPGIPASATEGEGRGGLPRAVRPFVEFPDLLRANGFAVAPDQTIGFIEAIGLLGPRSIADIRRAAVAMLAIPPDRRAEFDALFNAFFLGMGLPAAMPGEEDDVEAHEPSGSAAEIEDVEPTDEPGQEAATTERLSHRELADAADEALARFRRLAPTRLPRRRSYRFAPRKGRALDMRRTLRDAARHGGEVMALRTRTRKQRQRRVVLLVDVSGSMQERTEDTLRFAHTLARVAERAEIFTLGTRLTRVTRAMHTRHREQALTRAAAIVADIDGGTRIGDALAAFLAVPRYAGFARGAAVIVLSDGLERGTADALVSSVERLARIAWRIDWLSPLAGGDFLPRTEALAAILPRLDALADGATTGAICDHVLRIARAEHAPGHRRPGAGGQPAGRRVTPAARRGPTSGLEGIL